MTTFNSVEEMVDAVAEDKRCAAQVKVTLQATTIARSLAVLRVTQNLTQAELAARMGCTQSKISKLESSTDERLKLRDIYAYAKACGHACSVSFVDNK